MKILILSNLISHGDAKPTVLESFGEPPQACVIKSYCPPANLKGKANPDLPSVSSNYWPPTMEQFVFYLPFGTFDLMAMQVYNPPEICKAHSQYPPHSTVPLEENPPLFKFMTNKRISSLTWLSMEKKSYKHIDYNEPVSFPLFFFVRKLGKSRYN